MIHIAGNVTGQIMYSFKVADPMGIAQQIRVQLSTSRQNQIRSCPAIHIL